MTREDFEDTLFAGLGAGILLAGVFSFVAYEVGATRGYKRGYAQAQDIYGIVDETRKIEAIPTITSEVSIARKPPGCQIGPSLDGGCYLTEADSAALDRLAARLAVLNDAGVLWP